MLNKDCKYHPCHKRLKDCTFCYCPIYPCEDVRTGGKWISDKKKGRSWDCSECCFFHNKKNADMIKEFMKYLINEWWNKL